MEKVTITLKKENWRTLKELELKKDFKTHDEAVEFLFKKSKIKKSSLNLNKESCEVKNESK